MTKFHSFSTSESVASSRILVELEAGRFFVVSLSLSLSVEEEKPVIIIFQKT